MNAAEQREAVVDFIAGQIAAIEEQEGIELTAEAVDQLTDLSFENLDEDGTPQVLASYLDMDLVDADEDASPEDGTAYEPDGGNVSADEFAAALRGDYGYEAQAAAMQQSGLGEAALVDDAWAAEFTAQERRLEKKIGRELTGKERERLTEDAAGSDQRFDLVEVFDRVIGRDPKNAEDGHDVMVETFEEHQAENEDEDGDEFDPTEDDQRQAEMVADMQETAAE